MKNNKKNNNNYFVIYSKLEFPIPKKKFEMIHAQPTLVSKLGKIPTVFAVIFQQFFFQKWVLK